MRTKQICINVITGACCLLFAHYSFAQSDSIWQKQPEINVSGFVDAYYVYDFNTPSTRQRLPYLVNHNRHNEFNVNLALIRLSASHSKYRAAVAVQAGTYSNDNYAAEPGLLKNLFECNVGISLNKKSNLWLDAGILNSHIGFESAVSIDNWNLTRSLLAELSPYYMSGAKLTYTPSKKWELAALVCNGWQRIQRVAGNSLPSFGTQLKYMPSDKVLLNWSTFVGTDDPDATRRVRYFNNIYTQFLVSKNAGVIVGFDIGAQQAVKGSGFYDYWFSPVIIARYKMSGKIATALRYEYYEDGSYIIIPSSAVYGKRFKTSGLSLNLDYTPIPAVACRIEGRWLSSPYKVFPKDGSGTTDNFIIASSIAVKFGK